MPFVSGLWVKTVFQAILLCSPPWTWDTEKTPPVSYEKSRCFAPQLGSIWTTLPTACAAAAHAERRWARQLPMTEINEPLSSAAAPRGLPIPALGRTVVFVVGVWPACWVLAIWSCSSRLGLPLEMAFCHALVMITGLGVSWGGGEVALGSVIDKGKDLCF